MTQPPILPGMLMGLGYWWPFRCVGSEESYLYHSAAMPDAVPVYSDPATCGVLMAWCHRELAALIAATPKPDRPRLNVARVALSEARPWDGASVQRAVDAVRGVLP